jgi:hypothetical protein
VATVELENATLLEKVSEAKVKDTWLRVGDKNTKFFH